MNITQNYIQHQKIGKRIILLFGLLSISSMIFCQEVYRYMSSADHIDLNSWIPEQKRSFDQDGILMQNKEYHALTIAGFGILSYEDFITSGDSASFRFTAMVSI